MAAQFAGTIKSQAARDGKQSGYVVGSLSIFSGYGSASSDQKASLRRDPEPHGIRHEGDGADPAKPKGDKPQKALFKRQRILRHQW
jgi:hypothetical protein